MGTETKRVAIQPLPAPQFRIQNPGRRLLRRNAKRARLPKLRQPTAAAQATALKQLPQLLILLLRPPPLRQLNQLQRIHHTTTTATTALDQLPKRVLLRRLL